MTTGEAQPSMESTELRRQEMEFYEAIVAVLVAMPRGSTVAAAMASQAGHRARIKWQLKYGREAPITSPVTDPD
jgi:hypothetical protein